MGDKKDRSIDTISMTFQQKRSPALFEEVAFEIHPGAYLEGSTYLCRFMPGRPLLWRKCIKKTFIKVQPWWHIEI